MMNFVNNGTDLEVLNKSFESMPLEQQQELSKALKRDGLVQKQITVQGKHGPYTKMAWVKAGDDKPAPKTMKQQAVPTKDKKPSKSTGDTSKETKAAVSDLRKQHGADKVMAAAKAAGISWKENSNAGINWMRCAMAMAKSSDKMQAVNDTLAGKTPKVQDNDKQVDSKSSSGLSQKDLDNATSFLSDKDKKYWDIRTPMEFKSGSLKFGSTIDGAIDDIMRPLTKRDKRDQVTVNTVVAYLEDHYSKTGGVLGKITKDDLKDIQDNLDKYRDGKLWGVKYHNGKDADGKVIGDNQVTPKKTSGAGSAGSVRITGTKSVKATHGTHAAEDNLMDNAGTIDQTFTGKLDGKSVEIYRVGSKLLAAHVGDDGTTFYTASGKDPAKAKWNNIGEDTAKAGQHLTSGLSKKASSGSGSTQITGIKSTSATQGTHAAEDNLMDNSGKIDETFTGKLNGKGAEIYRVGNKLLAAQVGEDGTTTFYTASGKNPDNAKWSNIGEDTDKAGKHLTSGLPKKASSGGMMLPKNSGTASKNSPKITGIKSTGATQGTHATEDNLMDNAGKIDETFTGRLNGKNVEMYRVGNKLLAAHVGDDGTTTFYTASGKNPDNAKWNNIGEDTAKAGQHLTSGLSSK